QPEGCILGGYPVRVIPACTEIVRQGPQNAAAYYRRGLAYYETRDLTPDLASLPITRPFLLNPTLPRRSISTREAVVCSSAIYPGISGGDRERAASHRPLSEQFQNRSRRLRDLSSTERRLMQTRQPICFVGNPRGRSRFDNDAQRCEPSNGIARLARATFAQ